MTWWKAITPFRPEQIVLILSGLLVACGSSEPVSVSSPTPPPPRRSAIEQPTDDASALSSAAAGSTALTPLPSPAQVEGAVPRGRPDPFAALPFPSSTASTSAVGAPVTASATVSAISLSGVLAVGSQLQALVTTDAGSGAVCLGVRGRCRGETAPLLPPDWTVQAIDLRRGCLAYAVAGRAQPPVCMT